MNDTVTALKIIAITLACVVFAAMTYLDANIIHLFGWDVFRW